MRILIKDLTSKIWKKLWKRSKIHLKLTLSIKIILVLIILRKLMISLVAKSFSISLSKKSQLFLKKSILNKKQLLSLILQNLKNQRKEAI